MITQLIIGAPVLVAGTLVALSAALLRLFARC